MARTSPFVVLECGAGRSSPIVSALEKDGCEAKALRLTGRLSAGLGPGTRCVVVAGGDAKASAAACKAIRSEGSTAMVPVLVLLGEGDRGRLVEAGATAVLTEPAYLRDVATLARLLAGVGAASLRRPAGPVEYRASLREYGLYFLLRALVAAEIAATLLVRMDARVGEIFVAGGRVAGASLGGRVGLPALHALLLWPDAALTIRFGSPRPSGHISLPAEETFADVERHIKDFWATLGTLGRPDSILVQEVAAVAEHIKGIPPQVAPVLRLFDGYRTLADVAADSPYSVFDTLRITQRLVQLGVVRDTGADAERLLEPLRGERVDACGEAASRRGHGRKAEEVSLAARLEAVVGDRGAVTFFAPMGTQRRSRGKLKTADGGRVSAGQVSAPVQAPQQPQAPLQPQGGHQRPLAQASPPAYANAPHPLPAGGQVRAPVPSGASSPAGAQAYQSGAQGHRHAASPPAAEAREQGRPGQAPHHAAAEAEAHRKPAPLPAAEAREQGRPSQAPHHAATEAEAHRQAASPENVRAGDQASASPPSFVQGVTPQTPSPPSTNPHFSRLELEFFAQAENLQHVEETDTFLDLEESKEEKRGWFGLGKKKRGHEGGKTGKQEGEKGGGSKKGGRRS